MKYMRQILSKALLLLLILSLWGCGGDSGGGKVNVSSGNPSIAAVVDILPPGPECANGGTTIHTGIDENGNGLLDESEYDLTQYVCNGADGASGFNALISLSAEAAGSNCANGGTRVESGLDDNRNAVLDIEEVSTYQFVCNGADGLDGEAGADGDDGATGSAGTDGNDGLTSLVTITPEAAGANCTNGGNKVESGLDTNANNILDSNEILSVGYTCNGTDGAAGASGESGLSALVSVAAEAAGVNCATGGSKIETGLDIDGDSILDAGEITAISYSCNGADGIDGADGATGPSGGDGSDGQTSLVSVTAEAAGANCTNGGYKIETGLDIDGDSILDLAEVISTNYSCNGIDGTDGLDGASGDAGQTSLVSITTEIAGANCTNGGNKIETGIDIDGDTILDAAEVISTSYSCNGADGIDGADGATGPSGPNGSNGFTSLVTVTIEEAGANCVNGGSKIESGLDVDEDTILDAEEITSTSYACNGIDAPGNIVEGIASKGIIEGATVTAYAIENDGSIGLELGNDMTDANGQYSIDVGDYTGPVLIEVLGGTYTDEATGVTVDSAILMAVVPEVGGEVNVSVTPLTDIAAQLAGPTYTPVNINNANTTVAALLGGADILETIPVDVNGDLSSATEDEINYGLLLAAISQMVEDGDAMDVVDVNILIVEDYKNNGSFDNYKDVLNGALDNFIGSGENSTGLALGDITLDEVLGGEEARTFLQIMWGFDRNANGIVDWQYLYTYDANGREIQSDYDSNADGIAEAISYYTYNGDGKKVLDENDSDADGTIDRRTTYSYDANGNKTLYETDSNVDGIIDTRYSYVYDAAGNKIQENFDRSADGVIDKTKTWSYDAGGNMLTLEDDTNEDGVVDYRIEYSYDTFGQKTEERLDTNGDGVVESSKHYTYDVQGLLVTFEDAFGGNVYRRNTYSYDASDNMIQVEIDSDVDDIIDGVNLLTYDADNNNTLIEYDLDADGITDELIAYTYDANGNLIAEEYDEDADGFFEERKVWAWMEL